MLGFLLISNTILGQENQKVLVITGTHKYNSEAFNAMFDSFENMDCTVKEMGERPGSLFSNPEEFEFDVIVMYNFRQRVSDSEKENFKSILKKGVGLVVVHHALGGFYDWIEYEDIIGATYLLEEQTREGKKYLRPTWKHGVDMRIKVEDKKHEITKGLSDFVIHDEAYGNWIYHEGNHLLLSTENKYSNPQIAWTRRSLNSNVFCIQLGHDEHAFENINFRKLLYNGINWTAEH